jgi:hypothetical protein
VRRRGLFLVALLFPFAACRARPAADDAGPAVVAPAEVGAAKMPPALRAPHPAVPALPDLPSIDQHEAPTAAPTTADANDHPCHAVWTGAQNAPLACARALLFGAGSQAGAELLVPRAVLGRNPDALPAVVDHRLEGTEGPTRDQGSAPACTAFATAAAIDHALLRWGAPHTPVSVMQIWARYHSPRVETSLSSNLGQAVGPEPSWPFSANEAVSWVPCDEYPKPPRAGCGKTVDDARLQKVAAQNLGAFTEVEYVASPPPAQSLQAKLASGQDLIVAMELPSSFVPKGRAGARYVPHYTKSAGPDAGHALVLAGYARLPHGTYYLAHNSWGTAWGDGGYAWIHERTIGLWSRQVVALDAEPVERAAGGRPARARGETTCDAASVPDSISGLCAPPCPDGSPRHDGVCPVAGQCPAGYVNLTGACVLAAPTTSGRDAPSGVAWTCGAGGCSYTVPRASDPSCTGSTCKASCPAPDFHLAKMGAALVCVD